MNGDSSVAISIWSDNQDEWELGPLWRPSVRTWTKWVTGILIKHAMLSHPLISNYLPISFSYTPSLNLNAKTAVLELFHRRASATSAVGPFEL